MALGSKPLTDESFFTGADAIVKAGEYRVFERDWPDFLVTDHPQRKEATNVCKMIVATTWNGPPMKGISPKGTTYMVFTYQDDQHGVNKPRHFNKDVQLYTHDEEQKPVRYTLKKDIPGHVTPVAEGTAMPYLKSSFNIPEESSGKIDDLPVDESLTGPYPR